MRTKTDLKILGRVLELMNMRIEERDTNKVPARWSTLEEELASVDIGQQYMGV